MTGQRCRALALGFVLTSGFCIGSDRLLVVHDSGDTVDAGPWVQRPEISAQVLDQALEAARKRLAEIAAPRRGELPVRFPIEAEPLRPGPTAWIRTPGLTGTLFGIGPDETSLRWLVANAEELRRRGAQGFLVSAASAETLRRTRAVAARHGLSLHPMPGAPLAEAFGAESYPFVVEPSP